ncbi:MAG TPA: 3-hydroxyacyl-CoA dehydrogenase NAD-binding domain-containing protein [Chloroflexota bacterium]|nr:3-hydroxyacyl-CoA dehydrogenase NAD-binding domain-containing protein [Chloroflexota bacterium]
MTTPPSIPLAFAGDGAIRRVSVVGAGTMGSGIAQVLATAGLDVILIDTQAAQLDRAKITIEGSLARFVAKGTLTGEQCDATAKRIRTAAALDAAAEADILIEAVAEDKQVKEAVFRGACALLPEYAVLASNTSSISITSLAAVVQHPQRVVGMHFFNPVPLMPLVEVVRGQLTSAETAAMVVALAEYLGKTPILVNDFPGFAANRILMPMLNEAFFALMEGVAEREAIDQVMKLGLNHPMGPLQLADLIGLDVCLHILEVLHRDLGDDKYRPCPLLRRMVAAGQLGRKSGAGFYDYSSD